MVGGEARSPVDCGLRTKECANMAQQNGVLLFLPSFRLPFHVLLPLLGLLPPCALPSCSIASTCSSATLLCWSFRALAQRGVHLALALPIALRLSERCFGFVFVFSLTLTNEGFLVRRCVVCRASRPSGELACVGEHHCGQHCV